jgi:hypothetical protein
MSKLNGSIKNAFYPILSLLRCSSATVVPGKNPSDIFLMKWTCAPKHAHLENAPSYNGGRPFLAVTAKAPDPTLESNAFEPISILTIVITLLKWTIAFIFQIAFARL